MDRDVKRELRGRLIAMRGIVRAWEGMQGPDSHLALEWLQGLLGRVQLRYPPNEPLHDALREAKRCLDEVDSVKPPDDVKSQLFAVFSGLVAAFDREHGVLLDCRQESPIDVVLMEPQEKGGMTGFG